MGQSPDELSGAGEPHLLRISSVVRNPSFGLKQDPAGGDSLKELRYDPDSIARVRAFHRCAGPPKPRDADHASR